MIPHLKKNCDFKKLFNHLFFLSVDLKRTSQLSNKLIIIFQCLLFYEKFIDWLIESPFLLLEMWVRSSVGRRSLPGNKRKKNCLKNRSKKLKVSFLKLQGTTVTSRFVKQPCTVLRQDLFAIKFWKLSVGTYFIRYLVFVAKRLLKIINASTQIRS